MRLTLTRLFQALWSPHVHEERIRAVLRDRADLSASQLQSVLAALDKRSEDSLITGYESLIPSITLPDPDDRHVLAAAIVGGADVIVTRNLKDFPAECLAPYEIEAQHPDEFVRHLIDLAPALVVRAAQPPGWGR